MYSMRKDWNKKNLSKLRTKVNLASIISFLQYYSISILSTSIYTYYHYLPVLVQKKMTLASLSRFAKFILFCFFSKCWAKNSKAYNQNDYIIEVVYYFFYSDITTRFRRQTQREEEVSLLAGQKGKERKGQ